MMAGSILGSGMHNYGYGDYGYHYGNYDNGYNHGYFGHHMYHSSTIGVVIFIFIFMLCFLTACFGAKR
jgi:hypothetical protein